MALWIGWKMSLEESVAAYSKRIGGFAQNG
jgi:hypothetical protein